MLATGLLDLLLPRRCLGCGTAGVPLCARCVRSGASGPPGPLAVDGLPVWAAAEYGGAVRAALLHYKERGRRDLAPPLGALLASAVVAALRAQPDGAVDVVLVPVPSGRAIAAARGGDHLRRLARRVSSATAVRTAPDTLTLTRRVLDSSGLAAAERHRNVHLAMQSQSAPPGRIALLVDDIVTTGSTLTEAARALRSARWPVLGAAVVAATPHRSPDTAVRMHWQHPAARSSVTGTSGRGRVPTEEA